MTFTDEYCILHYFKGTIVSMTATRLPSWKKANLIESTMSHNAHVMYVKERKQVTKLYFSIYT